MNKITIFLKSLFSLRRRLEFNEHPNIRKVLSGLCVTCLLLSLTGAIVPTPSTPTPIKITFPSEALKKEFYDSPNNFTVTVTGRISGKPFQGVIPVVGSKLVEKRAFTAVKYMLENMLATMDDSVKFGIIASYIKIAIFADDGSPAKQKLKDLPDYAKSDPRINETEGVGATFITATQSIGEINAACLYATPPRGKRRENVFIHEFAHVVERIGLGYYNPEKYYLNPKTGPYSFVTYPPYPFSRPYDPKQYTNFKNLVGTTQQTMLQLAAKFDGTYASAVKDKFYKPGIYMISSSIEYFAEGAQAYFNGQARSDVNALAPDYKTSMTSKYGTQQAIFPGLQHAQAINIINNTVGINTFSRLLVFDPQLFLVLQSIYGPRSQHSIVNKLPKPWNFCNDAPTKIHPNCQSLCEKDPYY